MSIAYNPTIVTNGLTLALDPANIKSYTSGNVIYSTVSSNFASAFNNLTVSGGVLTGTGGVNTFATSISSSGNSRTVCSFFNTAAQTRMAIAGTRQPIDALNGWVLTAHRTTAGNLTYFHTGYGQIEVAAGIAANQWYFATATYDTTTTRADLFLNGVNIGNTTMVTGDQATTENGCYGGEGSAQWNGKLGPLMIYNRVLSNAEILQNFNALRGRYGI